MARGAIKNEENVRYMLLVVDEGIITWQIVDRRTVRLMIERNKIDNRVIKILRFYTDQIVYDTILKPVRYSARRECSLIEKHL